ncbi:oligopeptide/dipeptide ABC transporter ATP-binding protein [Pullulanibacillus pueri]|uniref:ABC transporter ATP-binding protein n=1 Tax=Pullulanibacillus pueri TaxID=1437324 RepID=A0A8J2ZXN4_9BACL|nr:ABC transporter ATP-binding protein [Pullulanibacillus pueri]MBM7681749.1 oligopeptide/dipeptide ABC transporter ATP-binding protein [Pullulanibacillus pueri]GGH84131.1 ABC transporter ATP-binding protein [Pullulanibacillus pueri]
MTDILQIENLNIHFRTAEGSLSAVHDLSFSVKKGETVCVVGESGCGKSISALSIMGLLPENGHIAQGKILFEGTDLLSLKPDQMRKMRGNKISMVFQEPMTALNPVFTIGYQLREPLRIHQGFSKKQAHVKGIELLKQVGLSLPEQRMKQYPHELSGGMRQRVMIAMALACHPQILIADEPTTALDVTIQAQILDLINDMKEQLGTSVVMITHDMGVVAETADRVVVMYAGEIVEEGDVETVFNDPQHPYTKGLLASVPKVEGELTQLQAIPGSLPNLGEAIVGCRFQSRCPFAMDICRSQAPPIYEENGHQTRCWMKEGESIADNIVPS